MAAGQLRFAWTTYLVLMCAAPLFGQPQTALPPIKTVDYDPNGAFRVNGKPFFPIALYDAPLDDVTLRELRDFGFNVLACDAKSCASLVSSAITAWYSLPSAAASRRARCQAGVPDGSPSILRSAARQSANTSAADRCPLGRSDIVATSSSTVVSFADGAALGGGQPKRAPGSFPKPRRQQSGVLPESGRTRPRPNDPTSPGPAPDPRC